MYALLLHPPESGETPLSKPLSELSRTLPPLMYIRDKRLRGR